jgi:hypothetical protein
MGEPSVESTPVSLPQQLPVRLLPVMLGVSGTTIAKHCQRLGIRGSEATIDDIARLAMAIQQARPGNPRWRANGHAAAEDGAKGNRVATQRRAAVYSR